MVRLITITFLVLNSISCSTSKQGRVKQGKGGVIESAAIIAKCTPPQKTYAKELEAKLKKEMDSLRFTPAVNFDASFSQKVVKLQEYSTKGLDWDLLAFRICEMANNRGMTNEQTSSLLHKALDIWENAQNKKNDQPAQIAFSINQQGGITANNLYLQESKFVLSNSNKERLLQLFKKNERGITVASLMGNSTSLDVATQIVNFFESSGYENIRKEIGQIMMAPPITGIRFDTTKYHIIVGYLQKQ